jgi:hypothetical protein
MNQGGRRLTTGPGLSKDESWGASASPWTPSESAPGLLRVGLRPSQTSNGCGGSLCPSSLGNERFVNWLWRSVMDVICAHSSCYSCDYIFLKQFVIYLLILCYFIWSFTHTHTCISVSACAFFQTCCMCLYCGIFRCIRSVCSWCWLFNLSICPVM